MANIKIIGIQMLADGEKQRNLSKMLDQMDQAVAEYGRPDFIVLTEYCYHVPIPEDVAGSAESIPGTFSEAMSAKARQHRVYVVAGSFPEKAAGGKIYNTCLLFDRDGRQAAAYRKIHLVDGMSYRESDSVERGASITSVETEFGRVGLIVCYDRPAVRCSRQSIWHAPQRSLFRAEPGRRPVGHVHFPGVGGRGDSLRYAGFGSSRGRPRETSHLLTPPPGTLQDVRLPLSNIEALMVAVGEGVRDAEGSGVAFEADAGRGVAKF